MMIPRSRIKWAALGGLILSIISIAVHLHLAKYSNSDLVQYTSSGLFTEDLGLSVGGKQEPGFRRLWGNVKLLQSLLPYSNPRNTYPAPQQSNGFIYAKISGGFEKIRNSIPDLVAISRLLNATLVIPEIQESTRTKGISSSYTSFSYLYNEDQFIAALKKDVVIVKSLPPELKDARKRKQIPTFKPTHSAPPNYYIDEVLPVLRKVKVIGLVLIDGGGLQSVLPASLAELQRLRCRVAFQALRFRQEILALAHQMVLRLRASGRTYLAYHPGLLRDALAYHGCAEIFQDVHTELIQFRRSQLIKQQIIKDKLNVDSHEKKADGSCPLMPEEVGLVLRALGYPPTTRIYLAGPEIFGGQRVLIPLRAMYTNLVDCTSLCSKKELLDLLGPEAPLPDESVESPPVKSEHQLKEEWDKAGPRPRPLPPPPSRPFYHHEKEGWYGWVAEKDAEPEPSAMNLRNQAHRLIWAALDYIVSVEADAFFPGFHNDGSGWPDFSSLVMGHRLYEVAPLPTYRPSRKILAQLFASSGDRLYHPRHNWTISVREHLNKSLGEEGLARESKLSKPNMFLSYPVPECSCRTTDDSSELMSSVYRNMDECPKWIERSIILSKQEKARTANETQEDEVEVDTERKTDEEEDNVTEMEPSIEQDEEMDPND